MGQLRRLGASLDYRRERMTMDEGYVRAVLTWFVHLHERGFLYRANRIVNWCPRCASAISDLEVNHEETDDTLYTIRYPLADGSGHIRIATVRPPTMLADVAVAVHPDDDRYRDLVGKEAVLPIVGRTLPIIADERVDPEFGTGAVKITPGHDPMDWEIGRDHELPELMVIGLDARMNDEAGEFAGLTQEEANERIVARLESEGLLESKEPYRHAVATCDRCGSRIEPLVSLQWWCDMSELAKPAIDVVGDGRVRFFPERYKKIYSRLDGGDSPLVHLAPALVGPPDSGVVLPGRARDRGRDDSRRLRRVRLGRAHAGRGRARHVVLLGALALRDARLARRHARAARLVSERCQLDRPRDHLPLGGADAHGRPGADGRAPVPRREHPLDDQRAGREAHVEEPRHRASIRLETVNEHGADATRYGLLKMSSTQDVRFSVGPIAEGAQPCEQALERGSADPRQRG